MRILDNFFRSGETIRGFATYGYGPVDRATGTPLGGTNFWATTAEVTFPFPAISQALGIRGARIERPGEITRELIERLTEGGMPAVIDVRHDANIRIGGDGRLEALRQMSMSADPHGGAAHP